LVFIFLFFIKIYYCLKDYIVKTPSPGSNNINTNPGSSQGPGSGGNPNKEKKKKNNHNNHNSFYNNPGNSNSVERKKCGKTYVQFKGCWSNEKYVKNTRYQLTLIRVKQRINTVNFFILNNKNKVC
jgi:hypothetical protein